MNGSGEGHSLSIHRSKLRFGYIEPSLRSSIKQCLCGNGCYVFGVRLQVFFLWHNGPFRTISLLRLLYNARTHTHTHTHAQGKIPLNE